MIDFSDQDGSLVVILAIVFANVSFENNEVKNDRVASKSIPRFGSRNCTRYSAKLFEFRFSLLAVVCLVEQTMLTFFVRSFNNATATSAHDIGFSVEFRGIHRTNRALVLHSHSS